MIEIQPIQIIGIQRSGSNMLRLMLNQLEEVTAPHPPHILQRMMPLIPLYGNLEDSQNFYRLIEDVCLLVELNPVAWTGVKFDRKDVFSLCKSQNLVEVFRVVYELKARYDRASFWVCKSMANVKYADAIEEAGIRPIYIHLYRDGRDVACSFKNAIVGEKHIYSIANQWRDNQVSCFKLREKIESDRFLLVSYEDLLNSPESELKRITSFINVKFNSNVFNFYKSEESKNTAVAGKMWDNVSKPIIKNNSNKYKSSLSELDIGIFEKQAGQVLSRLGYSLEGTGIVNGIPFTKAQLRKFDQQNKLLKEKARRSTDPEGMKLRERQKSLLSKIQAGTLFR